MIRWSKIAFRDFKKILDYLEKENPTAAGAVGQRILRAIQQIEVFTQSGRPGAPPSNRELVVNGLPYVVYYRPMKNAVYIRAIRHTSRRIPKRLRKD